LRTKITLHFAARVATFIDNPMVPLHRSACILFLSRLYRKPLSTVRLPQIPFNQSIARTIHFGEHPTKYLQNPPVCPEQSCISRPRPSGQNSLDGQSAGGNLAIFRAAQTKNFRSKVSIIRATGQNCNEERSLARANSNRSQSTSFILPSVQLHLPNSKSPFLNFFSESPPIRSRPINFALL
jgi:hypothetical protein